MWFQSAPKITVPGSVYLGSGVSMSSHADIVVAAGLPGAWVFQASGPTFVLLQTLVSPGSSPYYGFRGIAITPSAQRIVVGDSIVNSLASYVLGGAFVFDRVNTTSYEQVPGNITSDYNLNLPSCGNRMLGMGYFVAVSDENHVLLGAPGDYCFTG